jgi:hypothetical protein
MIMSKVISVFLITMLVGSSAFPMKAANEESQSAGPSIKMNPVSHEDPIDHVNSYASNPDHKVIQIDEEKPEEKIVIQPISEWRKLAASTVRFGTTVVCTGLGIGIGAAIITGEYGPTVTQGLFMIAKPVLIGQVVGYFTGWGLGTIAERKIKNNY